MLTEETDEGCDLQGSTPEAEEDAADAREQEVCAGVGPAKNQQGYYSQAVT